MLQIKNISAQVEGKDILKGVSLEISPGEVTAIMGPNGSGKSTLAYAVMGSPIYKVENTKTRIKLDGKDITGLGPEERSKRGLFLANQHPVAIPGLKVNSFLWQLSKKDGKAVELPEFRKQLKKWTKVLGLKEELLERSLNDGFSGGEKKKLEILQMLVLKPKYTILDEIDSGLDVDALKKIALAVAKVVKEEKMGVAVITHYSRILKYLRPDRVVVMKGGVIAARGGEELVERIEDQGYEN